MSNFEYGNVKDYIIVKDLSGRVTPGNLKENFEVKTAIQLLFIPILISTPLFTFAILVSRWRLLLVYCSQLAQFDFFLYSYSCYRSLSKSRRHLPFKCQVFV